MRKISVILSVTLCLSLFACITGKGTTETRSSKIFAVIPESLFVPLDGEGKVTFMGSGFHPGQEVRFLFKTFDGVVADIGYALEPTPVANDFGAWSTEWSYGRYVQTKLVDAGVYAVQITDKNYNILATTPICFKAK